tara:strand:- start:2 stop:640 length:639 start_codon:yes stop_codon:yes gene_type:complete
MSTILSNALSALSGNLTLSPQGTGKVIIDGLTHPIADGSSGQFMTTNGSGVLSFAAAAGGGKVLQVLYDSVGQRQTTTSYSYVDITNLSIAITPAATSSKILCISNVKGGSTYVCASQIVRGSTVIGLGDTTGKSNTYGAGSTSSYAQGDTEGPESFVQIFLDSPSTSSAVTYKVQFKTGQSGNPAYLHTKSTDVIGNAAVNSELLLIEIGA